MIITSKFSPSWWLSNPHLQTLYASKLSKRPPISFKTERLELPDGDFLDLCWSNKHSGPLVLMLHGLTGNIRSAYAQGAFGQIEAAGMRPVFMHFRGCSGEPNRLARSYHSGETGDISYMVNLLQERFPGVPISAAGFSLGANALLKYLGEQGQECPLKSAIAVCPPLVLHVGANKLNKGIARGYQRFLIGLMRSQIEAKRALYPDLDLPMLTDEDDNFWKVDNNFTAPVHGFDDVHDYYKRCSSRPYLKYIEIPTHIISALDDPFFTDEIIPTEEDLSPSVTLELSTQGGHVGFVKGKIPFQPEYWLDGRIVEVLDGLG